MNKITQKQSAILDLIKDYIKVLGRPPTRQEIATDCGFKSPNAAQCHLEALGNKGYIAIVKGASRGIEVCD